MDTVFAAIERAALFETGGVYSDFASRPAMICDVDERRDETPGQKTAAAVINRYRSDQVLVRHPIDSDIDAVMTRRPPVPSGRVASLGNISLNPHPEKSRD